MVVVKNNIFLHKLKNRMKIPTAYIENELNNVSTIKKELLKKKDGYYKNLYDKQFSLELAS